MILRTGLHSKHLLANGKLAKCRDFSQISNTAVRLCSKMDAPAEIHTKILPVDAGKLGRFIARSNGDDILDDIEIRLDSTSVDAAHLQFAAAQLRHSDIPVAFPTETVYGLGADATRSAAVRGIYKAKQRPADNPLIVHFASLAQLRKLLKPSLLSHSSHTNGHATNGTSVDPIPDIYKSLISRFWPGPLTIILPNPPNSPLAPEVTAGLNTFGARIPKHVLALALIKTADVPVAAPSANASTKPSPTAAEHVAHDLDGRIETILDGGPCDVGVESTVVDGLSNPPLILRPGGISLEQVRSCSGWEHTQVGYKDSSEFGNIPKAPGMKYRHYSPKATVVLYEPGKRPPSLDEMRRYLGTSRRTGLITTRRWRLNTSEDSDPIQMRDEKRVKSSSRTVDSNQSGFAGMLDVLHASTNPKTALASYKVGFDESAIDLSLVELGGDVANIARGIFSALRELDRRNVEAIFVEGINEDEGDVAAAVMNRLRKAAEVQVNH